MNSRPAHESTPQTDGGDGQTNELDVLELLRTFWVGRRTVLAVTAMTLIVGIALAFLLPEKFESNATVVPANSKSSGSLGQFADLAAVAGVDVGGASGNSQPTAVLKSDSLLRELIENKNLLPVLFARRWDERRGIWAVTGTRIPDFRDGIRELKKIRVISEDKKTGVTTITVTWSDAEQAAEWCNTLVTLANARLRREAVAQSASAVDYLKDELKSADNLTVQQAISKVIESNMEKMAFAKSNEQFAFKFVDIAVPAKRHSFPNRLLFAVSALLLGLLGGGVYVVRPWRTLEK